MLFVVKIYIEFKVCIHFRFEKDLLNRAEEAAWPSKDAFVGIGCNVTTENKTLKHNNNHSEDEEWSSNYVFDSIASDSPKKGKCHNNINNKLYFILILPDTLLFIFFFTLIRV